MPVTYKASRALVGALEGSFRAREGLQKSTDPCPITRLVQQMKIRKEKKKKNTRHGLDYEIIIYFKKVSDGFDRIRGETVCVC